MKRLLGLLAAGTLMVACAGQNGNTTKTQADTTPIKAPTTFTADADSLFQYVERQVDLGPRTPGSNAHSVCRELIVTTLNGAGIDSIIKHRAEVTTYQGEKFIAENILGCINPNATDRILLVAHYDTRPWADSDLDESKHNTPIDGANDGASGVAVLMEIARHTAKELPSSLGLDLLFVDMEDSGESGGTDDTESSWCLGTQEWVKAMPYTNSNRPKFGILLDMVGGIDAKFHREYFSNKYAKNIVDRVWAIAREAGYADRFINREGGAVVDDHLPINRAGIPCIDIIENYHPLTRSFNPTWHTMNDNIAAIDRNTLAIVAQTILNTISSSIKQ